MVPSDVRESNGPKVHPQLMEESLNQTSEALESLISKIFANISSLKSAYIQLQSAHTPYDPDRIQAADKMVISELKGLSELKHFYRENNPKPTSISPQDSRLAAEIQEQQSLLKTYEVMVKKFQSEIQNKDSEIKRLQQLTEEATQKRSKLEKTLNLRSVSGQEPVGFPPCELSLSLFINAGEAVFKATHDFSKPLINMMKAAGWDLDAAAASIDPDTHYAKRAHKKYAFESHISQRMFVGFQDENFGINSEDFKYSKDGYFREYLSMRDIDPLNIVSQRADSSFGKYCRSKYLSVVHAKMEASFFGSLDQRSFVEGGGHPRTAFYEAFLKLAKCVWMLHRIGHSFEESAKIFQVKKGTEFSEVYMESVVGNVTWESDRKPKVGLMVMPGFLLDGSVVQSRVYLSGVKLVT